MLLPHKFPATFFLLCLFSACKKDNFPETSDKLLQSVITNNGDSALYTSLFYDGKNRLVGISDSNSQGHVWKTFIEYDTKDNPIKFKTLYNRESNGESTDSLIYEDDKVIKKLHTTPYYNTLYAVTNTYTYDSRGRLIADSSSHTFGDSEVYGYNDFIYDDDDNAIQIQEFNKLLGAMNRVQNITASYNSDKNPYLGLGLTLYFLTNSYLMLSMHNQTKIIYEQTNYGGPITGNYIYEYSDGLPKQMVVKYDLGGQPFGGITTTNFYYR
jgi:hypothetical protein